AERQGCGDSQDGVNEDLADRRRNAAYDRADRYPCPGVFFLPEYRDRVELRHLPEEDNAEERQADPVEPRVDGDVAGEDGSRAADGAHQRAVDAEAFAERAVQPNVDDPAEEADTNHP